MTLTFVGDQLAQLQALFGRLADKVEVLRAVAWSRINVYPNLSKREVPGRNAPFFDRFELLVDRPQASSRFLRLDLDHHFHRITQSGTNELSQGISVGYRCTEQASFSFW